MSEHTAEVLERIAREQSSDPATDDLTVPLAIELAEAVNSLARITAERDGLAKEIKQAKLVNEHLAEAANIFSAELQRLTSAADTASKIITAAGTHPVFSHSFAGIVEAARASISIVTSDDGTSAA